MVKYLGYVNITGDLKQTIAHMAKINGWTLEHARSIVDKAFETWEDCNNHEWILRYHLH